MTRVVIVTAHWGTDTFDERGLVVRLVAGALAAPPPAGAGASVEVVAVRPAHLDHGVPARPAGRHPAWRDSVFAVHEVATSEPEPTRAGLVRAALAATPGDRVPAVASARLARLSAGSPRQPDEAVALIDSLRPDAVLLAGSEVASLAGALRSSGIEARLASLPLSGDAGALEAMALRPLLDEAEAIGTLSLGEHARVAAALAARERPGRPAELVELRPALAVNRSAAAGVLLGMSNFGRFVVVLCGFPPGSPGATHAPGDDYVRQMLGDVAVADVAHDRWLLSDGDKALTVPVGPSRVNLWRLLAHAAVVLDLRPASVLGRETLETLLFGTPVVVPEGTVAAEHAELSGGGLWYRDYDELFAAGRAVLADGALAERLGSSGRAWAERTFADQAGFAAQAARLVLGART